MLTPLCLAAVLFVSVLLCCPLPLCLAVVLFNNILCSPLPPALWLSSLCCPPSLSCRYYLYVPLSLSCGCSLMFPPSLSCACSLSLNVAPSLCLSAVLFLFSPPSVLWLSSLCCPPPPSVLFMFSPPTCLVAVLFMLPPSLSCSCSLSVPPSLCLVTVLFIYPSVLQLFSLCSPLPPVLWLSSLCCPPPPSLSLSLFWLFSYVAPPPLFSLPPPLFSGCSLSVLPSLCLVAVLFMLPPSPLCSLYVLPSHLSCGCPLYVASLCCPPSLSCGCSLSVPPSLCLKCPVVLFLFPPPSVLSARLFSFCSPLPLS